MDFLLLSLTKHFFRRKTTLLRICLGACLGGLWACIALAFGRLPGLISLFGSLVAAVIMIAVAFQTKNWKKLCGMTAVLYGMAMLLEGFIEFIYYHTKAGYYLQEQGIPASFLLLLVGMGYGGIRIGLYFYHRWNQMETGLVDVCLVQQGCEFHMKGLLDSGNHLSMPVSNKPVHIIGPAVAKRLFPGDMSGLQLFYLPFQSIGKENGVIPAVTVDELIVTRGQQVAIIESPIVGISRHELNSHGNYEIILHSDMTKPEMWHLRKTDERKKCEKETL